MVLLEGCWAAEVCLLGKQRLVLLESCRTAGVRRLEKQRRDFLVGSLAVEVGILASRSRVLSSTETTGRTKWLSSRGRGWSSSGIAMRQRLILLEGC